MQIKAAYRLRSYRITEYEPGVIWWETHFDFGKQRGGECFVCGNILILKTWSQEKDGLLIGEFLDQLRKLPPWDKTPYYCFASELLDTLTARGLTSDQLKQMLFWMNRQKPGPNGPQGLLPGSFRINRYRITVSDEGAISWQTARGADKIIGGPGSIESGILFLEPMQGDEIKQSRQDFLSHLSRLPQWTVTQAWCRYSALRSCQERHQIGSQGKVISRPERIDRPIDTGTFSISPKNQKKETSQAIPSLKIAASKQSFSSWSSKFTWPTFSWPGFSRKIWIAGLIGLLFSGLIIATIVFFHERAEKAYRPYWYKKHYHEHRGEHHSQWRFPIILSILLLALFPFLGMYGEAKADEKPIILEESGIHYPGGFDLNTVGEVLGKASHFSRPDKGPVRFLLSTDREIYKVLTSPPWYWEENLIKIPEGTEVLVRGSKSFGKDGKLYIIAQELRIPSTGQFFLFRRKDGTPLWKGHSRSGRESQDEYGSSSGERGSRDGSRGQGRH